MNVAAAKALALLALPGVGPATIWNTYAKLRDAPDETTGDHVADHGVEHGVEPAPDHGVEHVVEHVYAAWPRVMMTDPAVLRAAYDQAERAVEAAARSGLQVISVDDALYPDALRKAPLSPPLVLFVQGRMPEQFGARNLNELASVAIVGTRKATRAGIDEAYALGTATAAAGAVVVSGLAIGTDAAAHRGALAAAEVAGTAAPTVAVLGGAHDRLHPRANAGLAARILEQGGAVLSEHPPGVHPTPGSFLQRNRVIAGLCAVLVLVEAGLRSGARNTAKHASDAARDVLTIPARPSDGFRAGNLELLREFASPLIGLEDLATALSGVPRVAQALRDYAEAGGPRTTPAAEGPLFASRHEGRSAGPAHVGLKKSTAAGHPAVQGLAGEPAGLDARVVRVLTKGGTASFDGLLAHLSSPGSRNGPAAPELAGALVRLEMAGRVRREHDGRYSLRAFLPARP